MHSSFSPPKSIPLNFNFCFILSISLTAPNSCNLHFCDLAELGEVFCVLFFAPVNYSTSRKEIYWSSLQSCVSVRQNRAMNVEVTCVVETDSHRLLDECVGREKLFAKRKRIRGYRRDLWCVRTPHFVTFKNILRRKKDCNATDYDVREAFHWKA